eukprot:1739777-Rhodomonas_salina.1
MSVVNRKAEVKSVMKNCTGGSGAQQQLYHNNVTQVQFNALEQVIGNRGETVPTSTGGNRVGKRIFLKGLKCAINLESIQKRPQVTYWLALMHNKKNPYANISSKGDIFEGINSTIPMDYIDTDKVDVKFMKKFVLRMPNADEVHCCFTSFNPDPPVFDAEEMNYLCYGKEICPTTGRTHFQSYVEFKNKKTYNQACRHLPDGLARDALKVAKGSADQNKAYCSKDGDFKEFGAAAHSGQRNDLNLVKSHILNGESLNDLMTDDDCASIIARHMPFFRALSNNYRSGAGLLALKDKMAGASLRSWQQQYVDTVLSSEPHPRHVYWYWDTVGGTGKSFLCDYL